jgi:hypothetical protein
MFKTQIKLLFLTKIGLFLFMFYLAFIALAILIGVWLIDKAYIEPWSWTVSMVENGRIGLEYKIKAYLDAKNSPLAGSAATLATLPSWRLIIALAGVESSFCRNAGEKWIEAKNCWGIGDHTPWDFGDSWDEGVKAMQRFLDNFPQRSQKKYAQMSVKELNGLFKQPATIQYASNLYQFLDELEKL